MYVSSEFDIKSA